MNASASLQVNSVVQEQNEAECVYEGIYYGYAVLSQVSGTARRQRKERWREGERDC